MTKKNQYPKSIEDFKDDPLFYEEVAVLSAQETIAELMQNSKTTRTQLAKLLNRSKAHVTGLLSNGRNLTLRTFARVCFHLGMEVDFKTRKIGTMYDTRSFDTYPSKEDQALKEITTFHGISSTYTPNKNGFREPQISDIRNKKYPSTNTENAFAA